MDATTVGQRDDDVAGDRRLRAYRSGSVVHTRDGLGDLGQFAAPEFVRGQIATPQFGGLTGDEVVAGEHVSKESVADAPPVEGVEFHVEFVGVCPIVVWHTRAESLAHEALDRVREERDEVAQFDVGGFRCADFDIGQSRRRHRIGVESPCARQQFGVEAERRGYRTQCAGREVEPIESVQSVADDNVGRIVESSQGGDTLGEFADDHRGRDAASVHRVGSVVEHE